MRIVGGCAAADSTTIDESQERASIAEVSFRHVIAFRRGSGRSIRRAQSIGVAGFSRSQEAVRDDELPRVTTKSALLHDDFSSLRSLNGEEFPHNRRAASTSH